MLSTPLNPMINVLESDAGLGPSKDSSPVADSEVIAHALLRMTVEFPGQLGRVRSARCVMGKELEIPQGEEPYRVAEGWTLKQCVELIDALIAGGLMTQTSGPRPTLVLTRPGFRALEVLEAT